ncbi:MAG: hypothetical protein HY293_19620 [Planctomycetes bacterium]|nr:hypothetical protein [Planctomycetota bacterium]
MLTLLFLASTALTQDDLDGAIRGLAEKLSREGLSGKLAEAAASDAGIQAIHEKIDFLLSARISRFERDAVGHLEDYLFSADAAGDLHLRPERKPEIDALVARLPLAPRAMSGFSRRADEIVGRLGNSPMDLRAKAGWGDPNFRTAFFHRHPAELRELDDAELLDAAGFRGLQRGKDGRLRVAGPWAGELLERMTGTFEQLEALKKYEKSYLKLVAKVGDGAARAALTADTCSLFLIGRVIRQAGEGSPAPIGGLVEGDEEQKIEPAVTFNRELAELLPEVKEFDALLQGLQKDLDRLAAGIDGAGETERKIIEFVRNGRARALIAERILDFKEDQKRKSEEIMNATLEDGFTADGEKLTVKKGRYVDGDGKESPDALGAEFEGVIAEFNGSIRQDFDRIAERCLDPGVIALFEDRPGTYLLAEFRDRVVETMAHGIRNGGLDVFIKTYLVMQGDKYVVRPERASRVEAILKRATDITAGK